MPGNELDTETLWGSFWGSHVVTTGVMEQPALIFPVVLGFLGGALRGSNPRPPVPQTGALPIELKAP